MLFLGVNLHLFVCLHSAKAVIPLGGNKTAKFHTFLEVKISHIGSKTTDCFGERERGRGEGAGTGFPSTSAGIKGKR